MGVVWFITRSLLAFFLHQRIRLNERNSRETARFFKRRRSSQVRHHLLWYGCRFRLCFAAAPSLAVQPSQVDAMLRFGVQSFASGDRLQFGSR